jgi:hypothetical protein
MSETPQDRIEAFLNAIPGNEPNVTEFYGDDDTTHTLSRADLREILRANRSLANQVLRAGDTILAGAQEIQRATLRAAAADADASNGHHFAVWLRKRADTIGTQGFGEDPTP